MSCPSAFFALLPDFGGGEMMLILFVVLLLFGGEKMPQLAKGIGKALREFKKATSDVEQEIKRALDDVPDVRVPDFAGHVKKVVNDLKTAADPAPAAKPKSFPSLPSPADAPDSGPPPEPPPPPASPSPVPPPAP
jgi:sec-independent protein translocase protein TatA